MDSIPVIIIDKDDNSRYKLKKDLENTENIEVIGDFDSLMSGFNSIVQEKPSLIFIDISENINKTLEIIEIISIQLRSCIIYVTSPEMDKDVVIKALKAGAREFLAKPIQTQDLNIALEKAKAILNANTKEDSAGKIFTVYSNKGGIGKTMIATNIAVTLADITRKKVALIDLNLQLGDVTTFLDIYPSFDVSYVVTHLNRIDESFLLSTFEKYKDKNLYVLADPPYLEQAEEITSEQINTLLNILKSVFSYIIIDTGSTFDSKTLCCLDLSDDILLISMLNLPSIRNSQRCLDLFNRLGYNQDKIKLIINRFLATDDISVEKLEEALGHSVFWRIPNNYYTIMSSINKGVPISLLEPDSPINQNFIALCSSLANVAYVKKTVEKNKNEGIFSYIKMFFNKLLSKNVGRS